MSSVVPEGWKKLKMGDVGTFSTSSVDKKSKDDETTVCLLNYMDVYQYSVLTSSHRFQLVTAPEKQVSSSSVLNGDVFFTPSSETPDDVGHSAVFLGDAECLVHSYHTIRFRPRAGDYFDDNYKAFAFKGEATYEYFRKRAVGSTRFTVSLPIFNDLEVLAPPLSEQKKIASILTSVDEVIENTQKQIGKLQDLKKATMNELLTKGIGHTEFKDSELGRIPKSWEVYALSEIGTFSKGRGISKKETLPEGVPCLRYAEIYTVYDFYIKTFKSFISPITAESSRKLIKNEIIFAGSGETVEDIGKSVAFTLDCDAYVGGDSVVFSPRSGLDSIFLSYQLNDNIRRRMLRKLGQGSSVIHIYSSGLQEVLVSLPPLSEQKKIASILISMGEAIEEKLEESRKLQSLKKSLMQDLLTGKVRVAVN